ncbi:MAG: beta-lactamase family protein [Candidatus Zixiibacteriota bacterium]|nr:MAG: beta-lactamase family protein [candidate division Zixibacteria bacterium]
MKRLSFLLIVLLAIWSCSSDKTNEQLLHKIDNIENGLVSFMPGAQIDSAETQAAMSLSERMNLHKIPGVSVAVINDFKIEWAKAYGILSAESAEPVTTESIFEAASSTKMLVAVLALDFVERGLLDLDRDVNEYLKSWKIPENDFTRENKVTLRLLLTHQSGLNRPDGGFSWEDDSSPTLVQVLNGELPAQNQPAKIEFVPGSSWQYSNMGYLVIQLLLEDISGKPLTQIAREIVFSPLGTKSSTLEHPLDAQSGKKEAVPHDADGNAHAPVMHPTALAQGGLMTTPSDFALLAIELMRANQGESDQILSQNMMQSMFHKELDLDPAIFGGIPVGQGMGVFLQGDDQGFTFAHPGDNYPGSSCWVEGSPATGKAIVIMTNGAMGNLLAMEILPAVKREYNWP